MSTESKKTGLWAGLKWWVIAAAILIFLFLAFDNAGRLFHSPSSSESGRPVNYTGPVADESAPAEETRDAPVSPQAAAPAEQVRSATNGSSNCTLGATMYSEQETPDAERLRRELGLHLADEFCGKPRSNPTYHRRPPEVEWTFGNSTPVAGQVRTPYGWMAWTPPGAPPPPLPNN